MEIIKEKKTVPTRENAFDILRVISMIMVITVHVSNVYSRSFGIINHSSFLISLVFNTISRISVPIFLMISGALLLNREWNKNKYIKRIIKYIVLIIAWDSIYLIWEYLYLGITYHQLYRLILTPYRAHLWFLYTILILYILQPLLKIIKEKSNRIIQSILFVLWLLFSTLSITIPFLAQYFTLFSYIGFFVMGDVLYSYIKKNDLKKYNVLWILIMLICFISSIALNYQTSIKRNQFYNLFFAYRTPFIMFSSFAFFILVISNYKKETVSKIGSLLSSLSLGVYLIHGIFLDITIQCFQYQSINPIIGIPIFTMMILLGSSLILIIIKKIKILNYFIS